MLFKLLVKPKPDTTGKTEILIECYFDRRYRTIGTGIFTELQYWDSAKQAVTPKHPQAATVNNLLKTKIRELEQRAYKYEETPGQVFDFVQLKNISAGKDKQTFADFMLDQIKKETKLEYNSVVKYRGNVEIIKDILGDITPDRITDKLIEKLDAELKNRYAESTVARMHIFTAKYLKKAIKARLITKTLTTM